MGARPLGQSIALGARVPRDRPRRQTAAVPSSPTPPSSPVMASRWRPTPSRLVRLIAGLSLFGAGEALLVESELGNSPWTVFAEGVSLSSPLAIGTATVVISFFVLVLWVPLRQAPGLGTIANAVGIGLAIDATLALLPDDPGLALRWVLMPLGVALVAVGSGFYLTAALGPGPRDGLMTGINRRTGVSLRVARVGIELTVLITGFLLGGTLGVGRSSSRSRSAPGCSSQSNGWPHPSGARRASPRTELAASPGISMPATSRR